MTNIEELPNTEERIVRTVQLHSKWTTWYINRTPGAETALADSGARIEREKQRIQREPALAHEDMAPLRETVSRWLEHLEEASRACQRRRAIRAHHKREAG